MPAVIIKRRNNSGGWDFLYPQTTVDQIKLNTSGDALSNFSSNILQVSNATVTGVGASSFVQVGTNGALSFLTGTELRQAIGASSTGHTHTQSQITNLVSTLADKADLNGDGVIPASQIPDYLFSGLKFAGVAEVDGTAPDLDTLEEMLSAIDVNLSLGASPTSAQRQGGYFVVGGTSNLTLTFGTTHRLITGDEGATASGLTLEPGDWIVYIGYGDQLSAGSDKHEWAIINNTYKSAGSGSDLGIVGLSAGTATTRAGLSSTGPSAIRVMDEKAVRTVMKDIFYGGTPTSPAVGDLWFDGTF